jgi:hypothetical protein
MTVPSIDQVVSVIEQLQSVVELVSYKLDPIYLGEEKTPIDPPLLHRYRRATSSPETHG